MKVALLFISYCWVSTSVVSKIMAVFDFLGLAMCLLFFESHIILMAFATDKGRFAFLFI